MALQVKIIKADSDDVFDDFRRDLLQNFFSSHHKSFSLSRCTWEPPTDVFETADDIVIKMEIAGIEQGKVDIRVNNSTLTIRGYRAEGDTSGKERYHLMELSYGSFERSFVLPRSIVTGDITAAYDKGFLTITIPKRTKRSPKKIDID